MQGFVGALLAVPFAAVVQVLVVRVLTPWMRDATGSGHHDPIGTLLKLSGLV